MGRSAWRKRLRASITGPAWYCSRIRGRRPPAPCCGPAFPLPGAPGCRAPCSRPPGPGVLSCCTCLHWPAGSCSGLPERRGARSRWCGACRSPARGGASPGLPSGGGAGRCTCSSAWRPQSCKAPSWGSGSGPRPPSCRASRSPERPGWSRTGALPGSPRAGPEAGTGLPWPWLFRWGWCSGAPRRRA